MSLTRMLFCRESFTFNKLLRHTITPNFLRRFVFSETSKNQHSFTVSYLINSCGLSPESAIRVSKKLNLENGDRPNSVVAFLKSYGFSRNEVALVVIRHPRLLLANTQKTLLPKIEYFYSVGVSRTDLPIILSENPTLLTRSLKNCIVPCFEFFRSVFQSNKEVLTAVKRSKRAFMSNFRTTLFPNVMFLQNLGVPTNCLSLFLKDNPDALIVEPVKFKEVVNEVTKMGFQPRKTTFVLAVSARSLERRRFLWDRCFKIYRRWGWSEDKIFSAFRKHPSCMLLSEKKISMTMDFLVNKMGLHSQMVATYPMILLYNLEKRIIPRCSVIQVLLANRLIRKNVSLYSVLVHREEIFLEKFVMAYQEALPQLLDVYNGKIISPSA
ncbi:Transcription termination factor, mitochondrial/chloroplastic [Dillenia turbinata]|uniref:Transcription termination factor, mitochondrial/chloroplastic n=1 Tax=Dillenia turbinata TaxID=194707 RepID=A0AAN8YXW9_9MAGN